MWRRVVVLEWTCLAITGEKNLYWSDRSLGTKNFAALTANARSRLDFSTTNVRQSGYAACKENTENNSINNKVDFRVSHALRPLT